MVASESKTNSHASGVGSRTRAVYSRRQTQPAVLVGVELHRHPHLHVYSDRNRSTCRVNQWKAERKRVRCRLHGRQAFRYVINVYDTYSHDMRLRHALAAKTLSN